MAEMTTMTGRDYYIKSGYDELPEAVRIEMRRVFDTGVNNSGVWVRYKEVENLAGVMAYQYTHRPVATNADRIRSMSDEELAVLLEGCICPSDPCKKVVNRERQPDKKMCQSCWLDWLKQEVQND